MNEWGNAKDDEKIKFERNGRRRWPKKNSIKKKKKKNTHIPHNHN